MKRLLSISVLSILLSTLIFNCSNNDDFDHNETSENEVIFQRKASKIKISSNFYDNHFNLIESLGNNSERSEIINFIQDNDITYQQLRINK